MKRLIVGVVALAGLLGACSADETDFREAAEKYIRDQLGEGSTVVCQEPAGTRVGTTFTCSGTDANSAVTTWAAEITKDDEVGVNGPLEDVPADPAPADTTPADTAPPETTAGG